MFIRLTGLTTVLATSSLYLCLPSANAQLQKFPTWRPIVRKSTKTFRIGQAHANTAVMPNRLDIDLNGGWCQRNTDGGPDEIFVRAVWAAKKANGQSETDQMSADVGKLNDHGGPQNQEMRIVHLFEKTLEPGESAIIDIAMYGENKGTVFDKLWHLIGQKAEVKVSFPAPSASSSSLLQLASAIDTPLEKSPGRCNAGGAFPDVNALGTRSLNPGACGNALETPGSSALACSAR